MTQERTKNWTAHFEKLGLSAEEAFENWKRIWNTLSTLHYLAFVLCFIRMLCAPDGGELAWPPELGDKAWFNSARLAVASMLLMISSWCWYCCYFDLGTFGWFYGDFFLPLPKSGTAGPMYSGIYRYMNNPFTYLGHLWMYAAAILCASNKLLAVAFACQSIEVVFVKTIEKAHLKSIYSNQVRESSTAVGKALKTRFEEEGRKLETKAKQLVNTIKTKQSPPRNRGS